MTPTFLPTPLRLSREQFAAYVARLQWTDWKPSLPYLHNTGVPSLAQVKPGPSEVQWGLNLDSYYRRLGWHAGPHAVAMPDCILALCVFTLPGVAESCSNGVAWGLEMLGNYEVGGDDFSSGAGALVRDNAAFAIATMADALGWGDLADYEFNVKGLHFHHDCARDHHACPGSKVTKADMLPRIAAFRTGGAAPTPIVPPAVPPAINSVDDIQAALNRLDIAPLEPVDGEYGPITRVRVKTFQKSVGFSGADIDGWVGPKTAAAMVKALGG